MYTDRWDETRERRREGKREEREKRIPVDSALKSHDLRRLYPPGKWDREGHDRINVFVARPLFLSLDQPASQPGTLLSTWKFAPTTFRQHCGHRFLVGTGEECGRYCFPLLTIFHRNSQIVDMENLFQFPIVIFKIESSTKEYRPVISKFLQKLRNVESTSKVRGRELLIIRIFYCDEKESIYPYISVYTKILE